MAAVEEDGKETENERNLQADKTPDIRQILFSSCRVACKGFLIGGSLYAGLGLLSAVSSKKLFARPATVVSNIISLDLARFSTFIAVSSSGYKLVTSLLQKWRQDQGKDARTWWIPLAGGVAAGLASLIEEPYRRKRILLYVAARAVGALIITLNEQGSIPTVPYLVTLLFSIIEGIIFVCVAYRPDLLPPSYYKTILYWSVYYTDEKLDAYFRRPHHTFLPCSHSMHLGSCHLMATRDFLNNVSLYTRIYAVLYVFPLVMFKFSEMRSRPQKVLGKYIKNVLNSTLFFAMDATIVKYLICLLRNLDGRPPPAPSYIPFLGGFVGGLCVLLERPSRQLELLYYSMAQVFYISWKLLYKKKPFGLDKVPDLSVVVFCMSLMAIMYSHEYEQKALAPFVNRALNFLLTN